MNLFCGSDCCDHILVPAGETLGQCAYFVDRKSFFPNAANSRTDCRDNDILVFTVIGPPEHASGTDRNIEYPEKIGSNQSFPETDFRRIGQSPFFVVEHPAGCGDTAAVRDGITSQSDIRHIGMSFDPFQKRHGQDETIIFRFGFVCVFNDSVSHFDPVCIADIDARIAFVSAQDRRTVVAAEPKHGEDQRIFEQDPEVRPAFVPDDFQYVAYHDLWSFW